MTLSAAMMTGMAVVVRYVAEGLHCEVRDQVGPAHMRCMDIVLVVR